MSNYARNGKNANAALLVNVDPSDFGSCDVLAGVDLQRRVEQKAYQVARAYGAEPYQAPAQTVGAFLAGAAAGKGAACWSVHRDLTNKATQKTAGDSVSAASQDCASHFCVPTYERGVVEAPLDEVLPNFVATSLREALPLMGKKIKGFDNPQAILTGPETRSSSPVRICRSELLQAYFPNTDAKNENQPSRTGLYPGGIMSAAVDGMKVAKAVADCYQAQKKAACLEEVLAALNNGLPAIFPTDTVFGLGVSVRAAKTPEALFALKQRPNSKPVAWLVGSVDALDAYGSNVPEWAKRLADQCWPGALTLVVNASKEVPLAYQSSEGTIALRMPNHPDALALLEKVGPLATTSANLSGENAPTTPAEISTQLTQAVPVLWGETHDGKASAVVDATGATPQILREGPFNIAACLCAIENF
jgi:tRNA threonylcarbamoyl adenosine modification protein (Sua5/YciO/YrdC/YwlC family)